MSVIDNHVRPLIANEKAARKSALNEALQMQAMGHLAADVAHDLNNLIGAVICSAASLRRRLKGTQAVAGELETLELASQAAVEIARSLLSCRQPTSPQRELVKLNEFVRDAAHLLRLILPGRIDVQTQVGASPVVWVRADRSQLQRVLLNLAINARDAMPDGGTLSLSLGLTNAQDSAHAGEWGPDDEPFACLKVADTGTGMSPQIQSRLFEKSFTTKKPDQGTGLGLTIARDIVQAHGGRIEVHSIPGAGTTFTILLPVARPQGIPTMFDDSGPFIAG
jgi:two-component system cell cycle sensor histidine kinase/response regulator CckA